MFKKLKIDAEISIIGKIKNQTLKNKFKLIVEVIKQTYYFLGIFLIGNC